MHYIVPFYSQWSLRLDPNDRPTCSQLLRHELFTKGGWSEKFVVDLQSKIEREFEENPLLKNLGITIYGSVYESKQKAHLQPVAAATSTSTHHTTRSHHRNMVGH